MPPYGILKAGGTSIAYYLDTPLLRGRKFLFLGAEPMPR